MNIPTPALVPQRAVQRLPRLPLLLLCAAYVLPGLLGRDPWRNADITAFGYMLDLARGIASPFAPTVGGLPSDGTLLPYWLGALFIKLLHPWVDPALAARIPFGLLLVGALVLCWYGCYYLARTEAAQPVAFAFGGEAHPVDYARAIADGALLALLASLGLLQLGHETTPELMQFFGVALFVFALAASPYSAGPARIGVFVALPLLAASGAPVIAVELGLVGMWVSQRDKEESAQGFTTWVVAAVIAAALLAWALGAWRWRIGAPTSAWQVLQLVAWFTWPAWAMAAWTVWRWRHHWRYRHIAVPALTALVALAAMVSMGGLDRALMLSLVPLAVLAAFALPTLQRSVAAAIDWFSVCFFTLFAALIWLAYASLQTGTPARTAANIYRLAPGFVSTFSWWHLIPAALATLAWLALVRWRTGRHRPALWKSLVLPAGGVTLCWLLAMTLLLQPLDYARSFRALTQRIEQHVPSDTCIAAVNMTVGQVAALEYFGGWRVDAREGAPQTSGCEFLVQVVHGAVSEISRPGWTLVAREARPTDRDEVSFILRRTPQSAERKQP